MSSPDACPMATRWSHAGHTLVTHWASDGHTMGVRHTAGRPMVTIGARSCWSQNQAVNHKNLRKISMSKQDKKIFVHSRKYSLGMRKDDDNVNGQRLKKRVTPQTVPSRLPSLESWFRLNGLYVAAET